MEVTEMSFQYTPAYNSDNQKYEDTAVYDYSKGVTCPCTPQKTFSKKDSFQNHWKCKRHQTWLHSLNENSANYYKECMELRTVVKQQRILLAQMETKMASKDAIITYLETKEKMNEHTNKDLMLFD